MILSTNKGPYPYIGSRRSLLFICSRLVGAWRETFRIVSREQMLASEPCLPGHSRSAKQKDPVERLWVGDSWL